MLSNGKYDHKERNKKGWKSKEEIPYYLLGRDERAKGKTAYKNVSIYLTRLPPTPKRFRTKYHSKRQQTQKLNQSESIWTSMKEPPSLNEGGTILIPRLTNRLLSKIQESSEMGPQSEQMRYTPGFLTAHRLTTPYSAGYSGLAHEMRYRDIVKDLAGRDEELEEDGPHFSGWEDPLDVVAKLRAMRTMQYDDVEF